MKLDFDSLKDSLRPLQDQASADRVLRRFCVRSGFEWYSYQSGHGVAATDLTNVPPKWQRRYRERSYAMIDPVMQKAIRARAPFAWSCREFLPRASREAVSYLCEARDQGVRSGFSIPIDAAYRRKACLTFASQRDTLPHDLAVEPLAALSAAASLDCFLDVVRVRDACTLDTCPLTLSQLECLSWIAQGKANGDVAILRGVTIRAVEFHLHQIRQRLDVLTTSHAVAVAVRAGWI